jgi:hypothetical protein
MNLIRLVSCVCQRRTSEIRDWVILIQFTREGTRGDGLGMVRLREILSLGLELTRDINGSLISLCHSLFVHVLSYKATFFCVFRLKNNSNYRLLFTTHHTCPFVILFILLNLECLAVTASKNKVAGHKKKD